MSIEKQKLITCQINSFIKIKTECKYKFLKAACVVSNFYRFIEWQRGFNLEKKLFYIKS